MKKSGMVSIVGRPNVGKSTLVNAILGEKITIVSPVPQTTRQQIRGVYTDERGQIVFIDTPGLHLGSDKLDKFMNRASVNTIEDVDVIIHLIDANDRIGAEERHVINQLKRTTKTVIVGFNKVDLSKGKYIPDYIKLWEELAGKPINELTNLVLLPLSAMKGTNVEKLIDVVFEHLPEGELLYPEDVVTDFPQRLAMADLIREKLFLIMREEVPHSIAVKIEGVQPRKGKVLHVAALIYVERDSQKEIVIGKSGSILKKIGTEARVDLEELLGQQIFLDLVVKVRSDWRDDNETLGEMGYTFE